MGRVAIITGISGQDGSYLAEFLIKKDEDPVIFSAILKTFVINQH